MNEAQQWRHKLAEKGIECTPNEVLDLMEIADRLIELSALPTGELESIFDANNAAHKIIANAVLELKVDFGS